MIGISKVRTRRETTTPGQTPAKAFLALGRLPPTFGDSKSDLGHTSKPSASPASTATATTEAETVRFNLINPKTDNQTRMKMVNASTGEEPSRADLVKSSAIAEDECVLLDKEDVESVKLESARIIEVDAFA